MVDELCIQIAKPTSPLWAPEHQWRFLCELLTVEGTLGSDTVNWRLFGITRT